MQLLVCRTRLCTADQSAFASTPKQEPELEQEQKQKQEQEQQQEQR
jgi:hypothetical protein